MRRVLTLVVALATALFGLAGVGGCSASGPSATAPAAAPSGLGNGWQPESSLKLRYAENFRVDYYQGGLALATISDGSRFLVVPEGKDAPSGIAPDITVLKRPLANVYLAATAVMSLFVALDSIDTIRFSSVQADAWYLPQPREAMAAGKIVYGGKYSAPDYERILSQQPSLAIEDTMISHSPDVKDKLEAVGIPVLVDQSSHEAHPLGRTEWIKLYGVLLGKEDDAAKRFDEQAAQLDQLAGQKDTGKTVAFFYISSAGYIVTRKSGDYVPKMIELAGGDYIFHNLGGNGTSTVNLEMEQFYAQAKDADYIIYNSTIGGELDSLDDLIKLNPLLKDFSAVADGQVWCTDKDFYQDMTGLGTMITDIHDMLKASASTPDQLDFLHRLR